MDEQLLQDFLADAEELFEELFADLARLRERRAEGRERRELVARVFRRVHTVKGTAYAAGLPSTGALAHEFESLLEEVRKGRAAVSGDVLDAFDDSADALASSLGAAARGDLDAPAPPELLARLGRLTSEARARRTTETDAPAGLVALPEDILRHLSEYERQRLREAAEEGARTYVVAAEFDLATFDEDFRRLSDALAARGEVVSTQPGVSASAPERVRFRVVYAAADERPEVLSFIRPFGATLLETRDADTRDASSLREAGLSSSSEPSRASVVASSAASVAAAPPLVRVPLDALDELIASLHELSDETAAALDAGPARDEGDGGDEEDERETRDAETHDVRAASVRRRFVELEERLLGLRMTTAARVLERAARAAASAARAAGKEVDVVVEGGGVSLDKSLADALADPLLHLARNAVAHGVEAPAERLAAGKPPRARVRLAARAEGSRVSLVVADDGRGVDAERVARAAAARGLVEPGAPLGERQALRLIFRPGFSTADALSHASGRGVGLDAAERAVEQLGGELRARSRTGAGATFEIRVPTTLALVRALTLRSAGFRYCVDEKQVEVTGRARAADVVRGDDGAEFLNRPGGALPLVRLRALLGQPPAEEAHEEFDFVVAANQVAVAVDELGRRGEVLVRGLGRHAARWYGVSGAAELRDGTVALLLDLPRLLETRA